MMTSHTTPSRWRTTPLEEKPVRWINNETLSEQIHPFGQFAITIGFEKESNLKDLILIRFTFSLTTLDGLNAIWDVANSKWSMETTYVT